MIEMNAPVTETKSQTVERLKSNKNPWEALEELRQFALGGHDSITPEWANTYLKWWGITIQGDGIGAVVEATSTRVPSRHLMLRVAIPNGIVTSPQLEMVGRLAQKYARNVVDITLRQSLQLHWVNVESVPDMLDALMSVGLTSKAASGDVLVGVTSCSLAGCLAEELVDTTPLTAAIRRELSANTKFYNLPRKLKVTVTGCPIWCSHPEVNDLSLTAVKRGEEVGYSIRVGGGLSTEPHFAVRLNAFVQQSQAVEVVRAVMELFRQQDCLRERRENARLKYLFLKQGWTEERFLGELETILGYRLDAGVPEVIPDEAYRDHLGIHAQKQEGLDYVGAAVSCGRLTGEQLTAVASLAQRYGTGDIRLTATQNLIVLNVPHAESGELAEQMDFIGLGVGGTSFMKSSTCCTGKEFCKFGIAETKSFTRSLVSDLEQRLPLFDQQVKLNITGCGHGCGHHRVADIGLEGKKIKQDGKMVDGYSFYVGGAVGRDAAISRPIGYRCAATAVPEAVEKLLTGFLRDRRDGENLRPFLTRSTNDELLALLTADEQGALVESNT